MSIQVYQKPRASGSIACQTRRLSGTIDVERAVRRAWREAHAEFVRRGERLEEREACRWWHKAETPREQAAVRRFYGAALTRWWQRCKAVHGDAERFGAQIGGDEDV